MEYLEGNTALALDILALIDLVKLKLKTILKVDMILLDNTECYNNKDDDYDYENLVAHALLQEVSGAAYSKLTDIFVKRNCSSQHIPFSL